MKIDSNFWLKFYECLDYVPVVSTATNLIELFIMKRVVDKAQPHEILKNKFYTYLSNKEMHESGEGVIRRPLPFIPILGNAVVLIYDRVNHKYDDPEYVLSKLIETKGNIMRDASLRLKNDREFMLRALEIEPNIYAHAGDLLKSNLDFMEAGYQARQTNLSYASKPFILEKLRQNGSNLQNVFHHKIDDDLVRTALENDLKALEFAPRHREDVQFVNVLMTKYNDPKNPQSLENLRTIYNASGDTFKRAWWVNINAFNAQYNDHYDSQTKQRLRAQRDLHALDNPLFCFALLCSSFAEDSCRNLTEMNDAQLTRLLQYPSEFETLCEGLGRRYMDLDKLPKKNLPGWNEFWSDPHRMGRLYKVEPGFARFSPELFENKESMLLLINKYHASLSLASPALKRDRDVVLAACMSNIKNLEEADPALQNDFAFIDQLIRNYPYSWQDRQLVLKYVRIHPFILKHVDSNILKDPAFVQKAIEANLESYTYLPPAMQNDRQLARHLMENVNSEVYVHFPSDLQDNPEIWRTYLNLQNKKKL